MAEAGARFTPRLAKKLQAEGFKEQLISDEELIGCFAAKDIINEETGEILVEAGEELTEVNVAVLDEAGKKQCPPSPSIT